MQFPKIEQNPEKNGHVFRKINESVFVRIKKNPIGGTFVEPIFLFNQSFCQ